MMEHEAYLSVETGRVYWHSEWADEIEPLPDDIDEPGKYVLVPHKNNLDLGKQLVLGFVSERLPDDYDRVLSIFRRRGAYGRFKDLLEDRGLLDEWYEHENESCDKALRQWCRDEGIELDG